MEYETVITILQPEATTQLMPLPTGAILTLTALGGLPGPAGPQGTAGAPGDGSAASYDPGDLTVYFENGLV